MPVSRSLGLSSLSGRRDDRRLPRAGATPAFVRAASKARSCSQLSFRPQDRFTPPVNTRTCKRGPVPAFRALALGRPRQPSRACTKVPAFGRDGRDTGTSRTVRRFPMRSSSGQACPAPDPAPDSSVNQSCPRAARPAAGCVRLSCSRPGRNATAQPRNAVRGAGGDARRRKSRCIAVGWALAPGGGFGFPAEARLPAGIRRLTRRRSVGKVASVRRRA